MTIPSIPKSSPKIDAEIAELRRLRAKSYRLVDFSTRRIREVSVLVAVLLTSGVLGIFHQAVDGALLIGGLGVGGSVAFARLHLAESLRRREFMVVLELNEKFMKMFDLIGEGILTKPEFVQKAIDLVGKEQVDRFFERRELENEYRMGNLTDEIFSEKMSTIGYGPEQALEGWQFALWESDPTLRTKD